MPPIFALAYAKYARPENRRQRIVYVEDIMRFFNTAAEAIAYKGLLRMFFIGSSSFFVRPASIHAIIKSIFL